MKICKNCGRETDDSKVRCPHCGYLFEEDLDSVLSKMKNNLNAYKNEIATSRPVQTPSQTAETEGVHTEQGRADSTKERFELLSEVAQLKGELKALHGEIDRMQAARVQQYGMAPQMQQSTQQPVQTVQPAVIYAAPYAAPGTMGAAYSGAPAANASNANVQSGKKAKGKRSVNRIVISVFALILLGLSIGMFFVAWVGGTYSFTGFDAVKHLFESLVNKGSNEAFLGFLDNVVRTHSFAGNETISSICLNICYYVLLYGIPLYFLLLVLDFPLLFSLFGRVRCKGWHRFVTWFAFIVALLIFGVLCWVGQFSALTILFFVGAGANFVRGLFLAFYKGKEKYSGGLQ